MDEYDDTIEQFWSHVDRSAGRDACWNWTGMAHANGYGVFNQGNRQKLAHRLALNLFGVRILPGFVVLRSCENRLCCNPDHLRVVSPAERARRGHGLRRPGNVSGWRGVRRAQFLILGAAVGLAGTSARSLPSPARLGTEGKR